MTEATYTVEIFPDRVKVKARAGEVLADVLVRAGVVLSLYCHKRGICGKCAVRILSGPLPFPSALEAALLESRGLGPDHRLACLYAVGSDLVVETLPGSRLEKVPVLEAGGLPSASFVDPAVKKLPLVLEKPSLYAPAAAADSLRAALRSPDLVLPLAALAKLGGQTPGPARKITAVLYDDREVLDLEAEGASGDIFGLAVDLGTTTVAAELVDLRSGKIVDRAAAVNAQASYGADVVSRITFAFENPDNLRRLRAAAVQLINDMVGTMSRRSGVPRHRVYDAVVAGNTAMNHILCGVPVDSLALAPFNAVFSTLPPLARRRARLQPPSPGPALCGPQRQELRRRGHHRRAGRHGLRRGGRNGAFRRPRHQRRDRPQEGAGVRDHIDGRRPGFRGHEHQLRHAGRRRGRPPGGVGQRLQAGHDQRPAGPGRLRYGARRYPGHVAGPAASSAGTAVSPGRKSASV